MKEERICMETPITDIRNIVDNAKSRGVKFASMLMIDQYYNKIIDCNEFKELRWYNKRLCKFRFYCNIVMKLNKLPKIKVVKDRIDIEYEG